MVPIVQVRQLKSRDPSGIAQGNTAGDLNTTILPPWSPFFPLPSPNLASLPQFLFSDRGSSGETVELSFIPVSPIHGISSLLYLFLFHYHCFLQRRNWLRTWASELGSSLPLLTAASIVHAAARISLKNFTLGHVTVPPLRHF